MKRKTREQFIMEAKAKHPNDKYDYSQVKYENNKTKVCIICPIHGKFYQTPDTHLKGGCCPKCNGNYHYTTDEWIEEARKIHNNKYDYSNVEYINSYTKICIVCPKHGEFYQTPNNHLIGQECPYCKSSHMENDIRNLLNKYNINFEEQKKFEWMGKFSLDFYLPKYNVAIECQGIQHFQPIDHFGGEENLIKRQNRDKEKLKLCNENGIKLLYYANYKYNFPYEVITDKEILRKIITNVE